MERYGREEEHAAAEERLLESESQFARRKATRLDVRVGLRDGAGPLLHHIADPATTILV
jgi:hypothetical protein